MAAVGDLQPALALYEWNIRVSVNFRYAFKALEVGPQRRVSPKRLYHQARKLHVRRNSLTFDVAPANRAI